jgi:hypothetical protein
LRKIITSGKVRGSPEFVTYLSGLDKESKGRQRILNGLELIKENILIGNKNEKKKWPKVYMKNIKFTIFSE